MFGTGAAAESTGPRLRQQQQAAPSHEAADQETILLNPYIQKRLLAKETVIKVWSNKRDHYCDNRWAVLCIDVLLIKSANQDWRSLVLAKRV